MVGDLTERGIISLSFTLACPFLWHCVLFDALHVEVAVLRFDTMRVMAESGEAGIPLLQRAQ
jgi:hypothetical protein